MQVKGKEEPVAIHEPLGLEGQLSDESLADLELWNQALLAYRRQDWDTAAEKLSSLVQLKPSCQLYKIYLRRIETLRENPPGLEWAGVTRFETK